jgi:A/G-specific adenine glycosylase
VDQVIPFWQTDPSPKMQLFPKKYRHLLSHQKILASFWEIELSTSSLLELQQWCQNGGFELVTLEKIDALPKPKLILRYLTDREI